MQLESITNVHPFVARMQAHVRGHTEYSYYRSLQKAAIVTQCGWRQRVARRELRKLRMVLINPFVSFTLSVRIFVALCMTFYCLWTGF